MFLHLKKLTLFSSILIIFAFGSVNIDNLFSEKEIPKSSNSFYVTVSDNNLEFKIPVVKGATIQNVLADSNIRLNKSDILTPVFKTPLSPGSKIIIKRATPVKIIFGGSEEKIAIFGSTVKDALSESKIELGELDRVEPKLEEAIYAGMEIRVIRVTQEIVSEKFEISYQTVEKLNDQISYGKTKIIQAGKNGEEIKTFEVTREDGREVLRKVISSEATKKPQTEIIEKGTKIIIGRVQTGVASWYARGLHNSQALTAASRYFPRGTFLRVTNLANNKNVIVKVNDYVINPAVVIDLSSGAFKKISSLETGKIEVKIEEII